MKTYQLTIAVLLLVGIVAAGAFAFGFGGSQLSDGAKQALATDDYTAFKAATNSNLTQAQFDQMSKRYEQNAARDAAMQAAQKAIVNNDFNAWVTAMTPITKDTSKLAQDVFNGLVQEYQANQKIQAAITANDYAAWKQAMLDRDAIRLTQAAFQQAVQHPQTDMIGLMDSFGHGPMPGRGPMMRGAFMR